MSGFITLLNLVNVGTVIQSLRELHLLQRPRGNTDKQAWALTTSQNKRAKWKGGNLSHCQRAVSPSHDHASLPPVLLSHLCLSQSDTSLKIQKESPIPLSPSLSYCVHCNWSLLLCLSFALPIFFFSLCQCHRLSSCDLQGPPRSNKLFPVDISNGSGEICKELDFKGFENIPEVHDLS